ncbi:MAG: hypothetical protein ACRYGK_08355, partial [Janthinobacterium lividum]
MKLPIQIQFHRPAFLKEEKYSTPTGHTTAAVDAPDLRAVGARNQESRQRSISIRHRLMGGLITWNKKTENPRFESMVPVPSPGKLEVTLPGVLAQGGSTCKPTAIGNVDLYHATRLRKANIPVHKNRNDLYKPELNEFATINSNISVRQIAKQYGSLHGEVLQSNGMERIAQQMGYSSSVLHPKDLHDFGAILASQLARGNPVIAFYELSLRDEDGAP